MGVPKDQTMYGRRFDINGVVIAAEESRGPVKLGSFKCAVKPLLPFFQEALVNRKTRFFMDKGKGQQVWYGHWNRRRRKSGKCPPGSVGYARQLCPDRACWQCFARSMFCTDKLRVRSSVRTATSLCGRD
jgi:hypothetical protein